MSDKPAIKRRGFGSMDPARAQELRSKGGRSVPPEKRSFSQDRILASKAGRKGGMAGGGWQVRKS